MLNKIKLERFSDCIMANRGYVKLWQISHSITFYRKLCFGICPDSGTTMFLSAAGFYYNWES